MKITNLYLLIVTFVICNLSACSDAVSPIPSDIGDNDAGMSNTTDAGPQ